MLKRPHSEEGVATPMRKFRRPHSTTAPCACKEASKFNLNVVICKPHFGEYHQWVLQLHNLATDDNTIFGIQGDYPSYRFRTYQYRRKYYELQILKSIRIGQFTLTSGAFDSIAHAIERQMQVRNDKVDWNSQDYVFEVLDMLEEEWWLDIGDKEYMDEKTKLKVMYGPINLVQRAVCAYPKGTYLGRKLQPRQ